MKRFVCLLAMTILVTVSISPDDVEGMAAPAWSTLTEREQYVLLTGFLLGATYFGRSYDAGHTSNYDSVMSHYPLFEVPTSRIKDLIDKVYQDQNFRDIPIGAIILRWREAEKEVGIGGEGGKGSRDPIIRSDTGP